MQKEDLVYSLAYQTLSHSVLFGTLNENILSSMLEECTPLHWEKTDILDSDISMKNLYIIISGRLKVTHIDPETGRSLALFLKTSGDIFDLFSLLDGKEHVVFPVVMDKMIVLSLPLERARAWIGEHHEFNQSFLPYLGEKMRELENFGTSMVFHDTTTRLATLILKHTHPHKSDTFYPVKLINNLSHESLAELIGSVRSVVSTQMHKLKEEGIISSQRGHLIVSNLEQLLKKLNG